MNLSFSTAQVVDSPEHKLLMALRDSQLQDEAAVETFFQTVAQSFRLEGGYLILLAYDCYDVPYRAKDGGSLEDASETVYSYILCSLCPVKQTKPALSYHIPENLFRNREVDWLVSPPETGFLFPAFDDRCANLYEALYYTKNTSESHQELVDALFRQPLPPPADQQKETFQSILADTLGGDCSLDVVQSVQGRLVDMMAQHKEDKDPEPLVLSKGALDMVLSISGVEEEHREAFSQRFEEAFGENARVSPQNLVDKKRLEVCTPEVKIQVPPERGDLVETRIIDGVGYILIRAEGGVEVNGVPVRLAREQDAPQ